jgi:basic amino acid/polyamine antiporter, APA family
VTRETPSLLRVLSFWPLVLYGLSVIVGAGIYVAIGAVISRAGDAAPFSFLLAGIAASLTGLCYAELASRFPDASGAAAYVMHGLGSKWMAQLVGAAVIVSIVISAAAILHGMTTYLAILMPLPATVLQIAMCTLFTAIAALGVRETVILAAVLGTIEIGGLVAVSITGFLQAPDYDLAGMIPLGPAQWKGVVAGGFIAFFAFLGFESLVNMAEEIKHPHRTLPRVILAALGASIALYVIVATAVVLADRQGGHALIGLFESKAGTPIFALAAGIAVGNGALIEIVMLSRVVYGMARNKQLPAMLARVERRTRTPVIATVIVGMLVLGAGLTLSFEGLLVLTNVLTLAIFCVVDLALWRVHNMQGIAAPSFKVPRWLPFAAAVVSLILVFAELGPSM